MTDNRADQHYERGKRGSLQDQCDPGNLGIAASHGKPPSVTIGQRVTGEAMEHLRRRRDRRQSVTRP
jgi:hypothetical protein